MVAQAADLDCSALDGVNEPDATEITGCAKSLLNRQSLINTTTSINKVILDRFDIGPNQTEPAGLELTNAKEIAERLSGGRFTYCSDCGCRGSRCQSRVECLG